MVRAARQPASRPSVTTAFGCVLIVLASSCAPITTTVRRDRQVLSSRSEQRRSSAWSYAATSRPIDAEAEIARAEVEVTRARTCSLWTTRTVREVTVNDREYTTLVWPVIEWLVGVGGTVGAAILFAIEPAGGRDPMTDEFRLTPTGIGGTLAAVWGATGLTLGVVDLVRVLDDTHEDEPRIEEERSAPEVCGREPAAGAEVDIRAADGVSLATTLTDVDGLARIEVPPDLLLAHGGDLRLRVAGTEIGPFRGLDSEYADLRRAAEDAAAAQRRTAATHYTECLNLCSAANEPNFDAIDREPRVLDWLDDAFAATSRCRRTMPAPMCVQPFVAACANACARAPVLDPSAVIMTRAAPAPSLQEWRSQIDSEGFGGFRLGMSADEVRATCRGARATIDDSLLLAPDATVACEGTFRPSLAGHALPRMSTVWLRFCARRVCAIDFVTSDEEAGRGGILAHRDALDATLSTLLGTARREGGPGDTTETLSWRDGRHLEVGVVTLVPRRSRDTLLAAMPRDMLVVSVATPAARRAAHRRAVHRER